MKGMPNNTPRVGGCLQSTCTRKRVHLLTGFGCRLDVRLDNVSKISSSDSFQSLSGLIRLSVTPHFIIQSCGGAFLIDIIVHLDRTEHTY